VQNPAVNWLAHFALSPPDDRVRLGNWLPDLFPRAEVARVADPAVQHGIALHHVIDAATDQHPRVRAALARLPEGLRRGGGIVLDIYWDHFLAAEFRARTGMELAPFVHEVLAGLERTVHLAPPETRAVLARMRAENWLGCYGTPAGVQLTLTRIARRLSPRAQAVLEPRRAREFLEAGREELRSDFNVLWSDLTNAAGAGLAKGFPCRAPSPGVIPDA